MVHRALRDALQNDKKYAKAIVALAKIRTAPVEGLEVDIQSYWSGEAFPDVVSLAVWEIQEKLVWSPLDAPRLHKLTLKLLEETFRELRLEPCYVKMRLSISQQKKPHFQGFTFSEQGDSLSPGAVFLSHNDWDPEELSKIISSLLKKRKKLRGIGLA